MVLGTPAAHDPFTPAPQYMNEFEDDIAPRTPGEYLLNNAITDRMMTPQLQLIIMLMSLTMRSTGLSAQNQGSLMLQQRKKLTGMPFSQLCSPVHLFKSLIQIRIYRERQRTLLSVDDLVENVLNKIPDLDNTYVIFSSDHGYHLGQFGMTHDKRQLYEFDIRENIHAGSSE